MTEIIVVAGPQTDDGPAVVMREWVSAGDLASSHFAGQLVERLGWAVADAEELEHGSPEARGLGPRSG